jgi:hypothetical protein
MKGHRNRGAPNPSIEDAVAQLAYPPGSRSAERESWLLIFNCQADGLSNALGLLDDGIDVTALDPGRWAQQGDLVMSQLDRYARIVVAPRVERGLKLDFGDRANVWRVPHVMFHGYHPDLCYLAESGPLAKGPLAHYHSTIAYAAFRRGLDVPATVALFREDVYAALGYFDAWDAARNTLLEGYRQCGFALEDTFVRWSGAGPFMHTINHPKIQCLRDLASMILRRAGRDGARTTIVPHDNLANGPIFPVYPEVGARTGVQGSYLFKPGGQYRLMTLEQYVTACFQIYHEHPAEVPSVPAFVAPVERAIATLAEFC